MIFFFQREVLNYLGNVRDTKEIKLGKMFNAYLAWDQGRKEGRLKEILTWERINASDVVETKYR